MFDIVVATFTQLIILLGPLLILSFLMNYVASRNERLSYSIMGEKAFLRIFGWLGTAAHESGHALFAVIFGHKITKMQLFKPDHKHGTLGFVRHSYNPKNPIQVIGNFFIGIGPILFGSILLYIITLILFGFRAHDLMSGDFTQVGINGIDIIKQIPGIIWKGFWGFINHVFAGENTTWWKVIIFLYLVFSIGSSITLSKADIKNSTKGFLYFVVFLALFNLLTLWIGDFATTSFTRVSLFFSGFYFLIVLSILINIIFYFILSIFAKAR